MKSLKTNIKEDYKISQNKKNNKAFIIITIILLIIFSALGGIEFLNIEVYYQKKVHLVFSYILIELMIIYYISIFIHEVGHLTILKLCGYNLKIFAVGPIILINDNGKFKLRLKITSLVTGGLTMIDMNRAITCEEDYKAFIKDCKKILFGGTLFNIIFVLISLILMLFRATIDIGFLIFVLNILTIIGCMLPFNDISRMIDLKKNPKDISLYFVEDLTINYLINDFCKQKISNYIEEMLLKKQYNLSVLSAMIPLIEYNFIHNEEQPEEINKFLNWFTKNYESVKLTKNIFIRLTVNKLMYKIRLCNLVSEELVKEKNINKVNKHPLHKIYMEFENYVKKQIILERDSN